MTAAQILAEFRALGAWCVIHGPEIWLALSAIAIFCAGVILGMWISALLGANRRDDDER